ncbi:MAG: UDP-3-O-(3-hydroxymyristoyl)glucosamine N-acyltransferase [Chitinophagales bacterium]|nr:UDP-3-O-(3-hydroxymyristoyl)glucosamine N-acyltransferase [Chitinophagales bacterium]MDW8272802.1 UDP-3-O-(3-hydroxymyristoyl)glucosamine N-acyltransferase [Chitinophagales bacterium]
MIFTAKEICELIQGQLEGNPEAVASKFSKIEESDAESLSFIGHPKYEFYAENATAAVLIVNESLAVTSPNVQAVIRVADPYLSLSKLLSLYSQNGQIREGIESMAHTGKNIKIGEHVWIADFAYIGDNVEIGNNVKIYPHVFIGDNCRIGDYTIIYPNVAIYRNCILGNRVIVHSGAVIGADGFGFIPLPDGTYQKIHHVGNVIIGNDVEIGANTCIDRATMGATVVEDGVKLDNLIQIAHNVTLGKNTAIAALAGISGSAKLGKNCMVGGQAGVTGHIVIADGTKIQAQSAVIKNIETPDKAVSGTPAIDIREHYRQIAALKQLPELIKKIAEIEKKLL